MGDFLDDSQTFLSQSGKGGINQTACIVFFLIDDFCVNLRCFHLGMTKQFGNRVDIGSQSQHHGSECMAAAMERDWLKDSVQDDGMFSNGRMNETRKIIEKAYNRLN